MRMNEKRALNTRVPANHEDPRHSRHERWAGQTRPRPREREGETREREGEGRGRKGTGCGYGGWRDRLRGGLAERELAGTFDGEVEG